MYRQRFSCDGVLVGVVCKFFLSSQRYVEVADTMLVNALFLCSFSNYVLDFLFSMSGTLYRPYLSAKCTYLVTYLYRCNGSSCWLIVLYHRWRVHELELLLMGRFNECIFVMNVKASNSKIRVVSSISDERSVFTRFLNAQGSRLW